MPDADQPEPGPLLAPRGPRLADLLADESYPARAHAALEAQGHRLLALREQLVELQRPSAAATAPLARAQMGRPPSRRGFGGAAGRARSMTSLPRSSSGRGDDSRSLKRRRTADYDISDIVTTGQMGAPKYVERPQVRTIDTPRVAELAADALAARAAAAEAYAAALAQGVPEAEAATALDALCPGESSGDEGGSGDEAYALRHAPHEAEERSRYDSVFAGKPQPRNKKPGKMVTKDGRMRQSKPARTVSAPVAALLQHYHAQQGQQQAATPQLTTPLASAAAAPLPAAAAAPASAPTPDPAPAPAPAPPSSAQAQAQVTGQVPLMMLQLPAAMQMAAAQMAAQMAAAVGAPGGTPGGAPGSLGVQPGAHAQALMQMLARQTFMPAQLAAGSLPMPAALQQQPQPQRLGELPAALQAIIPAHGALPPAAAAQRAAGNSARGRGRPKVSGKQRKT